MSKTENDLETQAKSFLDDYNRQVSEKLFQSYLASWNYWTNMTKENVQPKLDAEFEYSKIVNGLVTDFNCKFKNTWKNFTNPDVYHQSKKIITGIGHAALPKDELKEYNQLIADMTTIYSETKVSSFDNKCDLSLDPDMTKIMKESRNEHELRHIWTEWHNKCGNNKMKKSYQRFVELTNMAAQLNGFNDTGDYWMKDYESKTIKKDIEELWKTIKPLYRQIHAYVRAKLRKVYPDQFTDDGLIPTHLLGNLWASSWDDIYPLIAPFPEKESLDVTKEMIKEGYTALKMFEKSDEFFTSLGLIPMPKEFWNNSMIEKPQDRQVMCQASAWDFSNAKDFRIAMCTVVTMQDFITIHHEMGHIQYFLQYKDQPILYRDGAHSGFHEAIGDTLALSVQTPKHLKMIGLLDKKATIDDEATTINFLFKIALKKIILIDFSYVTDVYRWSIFDGSVKAPEYNSKWWQMRKEYQGLKPPIDRSEDYFDAGTYYQVAGNYDCISYFVSYIIQFQFQRALCKEAGQYDIKDPSKPLHKCDIYNNKEAGSKLASFMKLGASRPWPEVMKNITGQDNIDTSAILEYFKPLEDWLKEQNKELGVKVGW